MLTGCRRLYPPEIMPLAFRAKGVSISTATVCDPPVDQRKPNVLFLPELAFRVSSCSLFVRRTDHRPELLGRRLDTRLSGAYRLAIVPDARLLLRPVFRAG